MIRVDTLCDNCGNEIADRSQVRVSATFEWEGSISHTYMSPRRDFCDSDCLCNFVDEQLPDIIEEQRGRPSSAVVSVKR